MDQQAYLEARRHGTSDFPMAHYHLDATHPRYVMEAHWHMAMECIRVLRGSFSAYLNNQRYLLTAGDILLVECGCLHRGEPAAGCVYDCLVFSVPSSGEGYGAVFQRTAPLTMLSAGINRRITANDGTLYEAASALINTVRDKAADYALAAYGYLFLMLAQLHTKAASLKEAPAPPRGAHVVMRVLERLERDFREEFSLKTLAADLGVSEKCLCRLFKEYTGKTIVEHLNERRVENACREIAAGRSITVAAFDSGFNDVSYFCKTFKKYKGVTPSAYKKARA
ncbi:MAG: helix-turn-helix domain-containing protein [Ruminococcaceae bacterium]|nr:helix-turn-helix domain-containing protein [Oscillospiraceae bacterium]